MSKLLESSHNVSRRHLLRAGLAGTTIGLVGAVLAPASLVGAQVEGASSVVGEIDPAPIRIPSRKDDAGRRFDVVAVGGGLDAQQSGRSELTVRRGRKPNRSIIADLFMAGTVKNVDGKWLFWDMTSGSEATLSPDHYYFTA